MSIGIDLPDNVVVLLDRLKEQGYFAHVVGGAVRDSVIGRELGDFDITTSARPEEIKRVFGDLRTVDTGIKHGTVTVIMDHTPYEITTYRIDGGYRDNRHPDGVVFTDSLSEDLKRRDFTVNAMAYDPDLGITDPFGGIGDIERRLIRAVGDASLRFDEDGLRILRALRFASVLDFGIEPLTAAALHGKRELLRGISKERIYTELTKLIMGAGALRIIREYSDVISIAFDGAELLNLPDDEAFGKADLLTRLGILFLLNSQEPAKTAERVLASLKTDKLTRTRLTSILSAYGCVRTDTDNSLLHSLAEYGETTVQGAVLLGITAGKFGNDVLMRLDAILQSGKVYQISGLNISGNDILSLGIAGEGVGTALRDLLYAVIDGRCENRRDSLLDYLSKTENIYSANRS